MLIFFFLFFSWCEYFPRIVLVALMKSIPESVLQQQPTNYSPRAKWGPPSISMYLALKQRIVFRFLKVGEKRMWTETVCGQQSLKYLLLTLYRKSLLIPDVQNECLSMCACVTEEQKEEIEKGETLLYWNKGAHHSWPPGQQTLWILWTRCS